MAYRKHYDKDLKIFRFNQLILIESYVFLAIIMRFSPWLLVFLAMISQTFVIKFCSIKTFDVQIRCKFDTKLTIEGQIRSLFLYS